jgi:hypothetical protein
MCKHKMKVGQVDYKNGIFIYKPQHKVFTSDISAY